MRGLGWQAGLLGRLYSLLHRLNLPFLGVGALCGCLEAFLSILRLPPEYFMRGQRESTFLPDAFSCTARRRSAATMTHTHKAGLAAGQSSFT